MNYILFDDDSRLSLLPLTFTRPVAEIRIGILTIREKWEKHLSLPCSFLTEQYLGKKFPLQVKDDNVFINASVLPEATLVDEILKLNPGESLIWNEIILATRLDGNSAKGINSYKDFQVGKPVSTNSNPFRIEYNWDIFSKNEQALKSDFELLTKGRKSAAISSSNKIIKPENIFLEEGARVECALLNASAGPIYISKDAEIMEGAMVRGPFSLGEHSQLKMGAKIYGATTIGPSCKVGGEVSNSVIFGYSNKAHDGFLGNSVIGEWCNLGADSNNSNLKNNYSNVRMWNYKEEDYVNTGLQFCGLIMADHAKCSINTMFNTGTVVGVSSNIFGSGFPQKNVPSFSWGGSEEFSTYRLDQAMEVATRVYERRGVSFNEVEQTIFKYLFELTTKYRSW
jgi:UDP-N-acetylglucosamine diphosphorylase/glucosamine-1-phosphate N-acetyltransferase